MSRVCACTRARGTSYKPDTAQTLRSLLIADPRTTMSMRYTSSHRSRTLWTVSWPISTRESTGSHTWCGRAVSRHKRQCQWKLRRASTTPVPQRPNRQIDHCSRTDCAIQSAQCRVLSPRIASGHIQGPLQLSCPLSPRLQQSCEAASRGHRAKGEQERVHGRTGC